MDSGTLGVTLPPRVRLIITDVETAHRLRPGVILGSQTVHTVAMARHEAMSKVRDLHPRPSWRKMAGWFNRTHSGVAQAVRETR